MGSMKQWDGSVDYREGWCTAITLAVAPELMFTLHCGRKVCGSVSAVPIATDTYSQSIYRNDAQSSQCHLWTRSGYASWRYSEKKSILTPSWQKNPGHCSLMATWKQRLTHNLSIYHVHGQKPLHVYITQSPCQYRGFSLRISAVWLWL